jgi:hypothetical protein
MMNTDIQLSFVVPVYGEPGSVETFLRGLIAEADCLDESYDIVVVTDGSSDEMDTMLRRVDADFGCLQMLELSRAFGVDVALTAGVEAASGASVITFDRQCDNWQAVVGSLLAAHRQGVEVVDAVGPKRPAVSLLARIDGVLGAPSVSRLVDMRLIARPVVDAIKASGWSVCLPAALERAGFRQQTIRHESPTTDWSSAPDVKPTWWFWTMWGICAALLGTTVTLLVITLCMTVTGNGSLGLWGVTLFTALLTSQVLLVAGLSRQVILQRGRLTHEKLYIVRDTTRLDRDDDSANDAAGLTGAGYVVYT